MAIDDSELLNGARSTRMTSEQIRRRMLDTALQSVGQGGMSLGFPGLQMDEVITAAGVSRSSVYRIWNSKELFIGDLLNEAASHFSAELSDDRALRTAIDLISSRPDLHSSESGRLRLIREAIRVVLEQNFYSTIDSPAWQSFLATSAALLADDGNEALRRVAETLRQGSDRFIADMAAFHEALTCLLGFKLRDDFVGGYTLYAVLGSSIVEGLAVRHLSNPTVTDNFYMGPPTLTDEPTEWAPSAIGFLAIFDQFLVADPDFDPSTICACLEELDRTTQRRSAAVDEP
ncbi:TetR/AcrR family transcriptional regulator [Agreia sp. VKM Ac-1783]|uniref:TetR/AcrR family transcriptional regulator n=1 Tax=Agreia sp. VKM Ac-1783 TaxID=1938889 RepID=UPI000A2AD8BD|nr:TetR/AcrR family transcriptional regulator [Agreia sp. VKM Ac-1783]SMQ68212.1 transcriptional regulator, TetR family [Agreia sp. VKM Ac-1783]